MTRVVQPAGERGSLKWIQRAVNQQPALLDVPLLAALPGSTHIKWRSPLTADGFAEYRDADFLERVGLGRLADKLSEFWPTRGPQWDALAITDNGIVLLIEAKAHLAELFSPASQAGEASMPRIVEALRQTQEYAKAEPLVPWHQAFYQLANRLAHLHFLRSNGVDARLVLVNFVGAEDVSGPATAAEWEAAYLVVDYVLGLSKRNALAPYVLHVYPNAAALS